MKKIWTLAAGILTAAAFTFAQEDDYYAEQAYEPAEQEETAQAESTEYAEQDASADNQEESQDETPVARQDNPENGSSAPAAPQANAAIDQAYAQNESAIDETSETGVRKQGPSFGFGARAAFNYGMMYGFNEESDDVDKDPSGIGFDAGLMARIQMIPNLYFTPELNIAYMSTSHEFNNRERTYKSTDLEIPLLIRGVIADKFYITGGPQINFNIAHSLETEKQVITMEQKNDNGKTETRVLDESPDEKVDAAAFTFGIAAGAGYNIVEGLYIDFRFYMGLMELYPDVKGINGDYIDKNNFSSLDMTGAKMMKIKAGLSYWFI